MKVWKVLTVVLLVVLVAGLCLMITGCEDSQSERNDRKVVDNQQQHYQKAQPLPFYDYSIPRDVLTQIYNVVTTEARNTFTVIESITGVVKFSGPSIGYGIPADTQLSNGQQPSETGNGAVTIEQAEPNGLFSSKNTDGTWVLFVDRDGQITPIYTEQKVTTYPFAVKQNTNGEWVRADDTPAAFNIDMSKTKKK